MKTVNNLSLFFCFIATFFIMHSCTKQDARLVAQQQKDFSNSSLIQVYLATVNASRNYVYVDAAPITGATMSSGSVFPSGTGAIASSIPSGLKAFLIRDTSSAATQVPLAFAENMQVGKSYTIFVYDSINAPKQKTVPTDISIPSDTTARLRFANFVYSSVAVPAVDIFSKRRNVNLFTNVQVTEVTSYLTVPSAFNDTFYVRESGTLNQLAALNGLNPTQKRSYTLVFRGRYQTAGTTGVARTLSSFLNY
jgi:hypothetical protein